MVALNINSAVDALAKGLEAYFENYDYLWKSTESLQAFEPKKPKVYKFCIPPTDLNATGFPCNLPCLLLALEKITRVDNSRLLLDISCNCVVVDPAIIDREKVYKLDNGAFAFDSGDGFEQNAESLYKSCLLLASCVVDAISLMTTNTKESIKAAVNEFEPPHALLPDYPFCVCSVPIKLEAVNNYKKEQAFDNLL